MATTFRPGERFAEMDGWQPKPGERGIFATLGWRRVEVAPGRAVLEWEPTIDHAFPAGNDWIVHGGMVTAILDTAMGSATWTLLDRDEVFLTADLRTEFYRPARRASTEPRHLLRSPDRDRRCRRRHQRGPARHRGDRGPAPPSGGAGAGLPHARPPGARPDHLRPRVRRGAQPAALWDPVRSSGGPAGRSRSHHSPALVQRWAGRFRGRAFPPAASGAGAEAGPGGPTRDLAGGSRTANARDHRPLRGWLAAGVLATRRLSRAAAAHPAGAPRRGAIRAVL